MLGQIELCILFYSIFKNTYCKQDQLLKNKDEDE
jgi:hypothetical protein